MKKIFFLALSLSMTLLSFAQSGDTARDQLTKIFQYIDKSQIPSGYLDEYSPQVVYKKWLNGILSDSNGIFDITTFNFLYNDIENANLYTGAPVMTTLEIIDSLITKT